MKLLNYMNLYGHPVRLSFLKDRTEEFVDVYHAHQGMELLYVHEGYGQAIVSQRIVDIYPGCLFFFRPFQLHRVRMKVGPDSPYIRSLFVFEPSELDAYLAPFATLRAFFRRLWKEPLEAARLPLELPPEAVRGMFEDYRDRITEASEERKLEAQMLFLVALLHLIFIRESPRSLADPLQLRHSIAERVMTWLEEHYAEEFKLKLLADELHLTPNYVSAAFRQQTGTSITEYLTARRIRQACLLLRTEEMSVQEVGRAVGLGNGSYFCNLFKKQVGLSPYRYKRSEGYHNVK